VPLYEYECKSCGIRTEVIQRVGAPALGPCEECGGEMVRLLSAPAFQFKGTGWYVTDYAKKSGSAANESKSKANGSKSSDSSSSGAKDSSTSSKSESKKSD
jgi:putative FmdB family regulatory protein